MKYSWSSLLIGAMTALLLAFTHIPAGAEEAPAKKTEPSPPVNLPIPDSPATGALGLTGTILRPSTAREFAVSLANAVDRNGKVKPTVSMEISPYLLYNRGMPIDKYAEAVDRNASEAMGRTILKRNPLSFTWTLANTSISVATGAKDGSNDFSKRAAIGFKVPLFDEGDPRLNYAFSKCVRELNAKLAAPVIDPEPGAIDKSTERLKGEAACVTKANKLHWNRSAAALALAQSYLDVGDATKANLTRDARVAWFSYARGYNRDLKADNSTEGDGAGQFVLQAKNIRNALDPKAAAGVVTRFDSNSGYARWRFGSSEVNFDISGSQERRKYEDGRRDRVNIVAAGAEMKLGDYWLSLSFGREQSDIGGSKPFVLANFNWAFNNEANLVPK